MKVTASPAPRVVRYWALALLVCLCVLGAFQPRLSAQDTVVLVGSGSSVPAPLYSRWASEYNKRNPKWQMRYLPMGTSEGIKQISHGSGDFGAGEVPLSNAERSDANLTELPSMIIGIVPIYNLPGAPQDLKFTGEVLAEIYLGQIKTWNAPQIAKLNPDANLPSTPIKIVYRPGGKGSNYVFTDFLSKTSAKFKSEIGVSASPKWSLGTPAERSSDMVDKVKAETGSVGYVELQYAVKGGVGIGRVQNPAGKFVKASSESITAACKSVEAPSWDKFAAGLTNAPGPDAWPITSFTWLYLKSSGNDTKRAAALNDLLSWMYSNGQQMGEQEGYSELPEQLLAKVRAKAGQIH